MVPCSTLAGKDGLGYEIVRTLAAPRRERGTKSEPGLQCKVRFGFEALQRTEVRAPMAPSRCVVCNQRLYAVVVCAGRYTGRRNGKGSRRLFGLRWKRSGRRFALKSLTQLEKIAF